MGKWISKLFGFESDPARVVMIGLDAAGKTSLLYKMHLGEVITTIPTIGFNVEQIKAPHGLELTIFDVGGQDKIRPLWKHYYQNTDGVIFVVDCLDSERFEMVSEELFSLTRFDELEGVPILVFANKIDRLKEEKLDVQKLAKDIKLPLIKNHPWFIQPSSAYSGNGLYEGMEWLSNQIKLLRKKRNI